MKICPYCGKKLFDEAEFCLYCMTPLIEKKDLTPKSKKLVLKIIAMVAAAVIVSATVTAAVITVLYSKNTLRSLPSDAESVTVDASADESTASMTVSDIPYTVDDGSSQETSTDGPNTITEPYTSTFDPVTVSTVTDTPETGSNDETSTVTQADVSQTETDPETEESVVSAKEVTNTNVPETTMAETETPEIPTDVVTTETVSEYVMEPYHILTIQEMHDFMEYKRGKYCPPPVDTLWCTTPLYDMNGWRGYGYEYRQLIRELDENENVITRYGWVSDDIIEVYISENEIKSVFSSTYTLKTNLYHTDDYINAGIGVIGGASAHIVDAVGLIEYINQYPPELNQFYDARMYALKHGLWVSERKLPGFQKQERPDGWRGILQELGINDKNDLQNEGKRENVQCYYWEIILPEGERDIKLTFEYREFTTVNGEETHLEAVMVVEYAE